MLNPNKRKVLNKIQQIQQNSANSAMFANKTYFGKKISPRRETLHTCQSFETLGHLGIIRHCFLVEF